MEKSYMDLHEQVKKEMAQFASESPEVMKSFMQLHEVAGKDGVLSAKTKELVALGISITDRCEGCIIIHINAALKAGATHDEIVEVIGIAVYMGGGPSVVYGSKALAILKEFESKK